MARLLFLTLLNSLMLAGQVAASDTDSLARHALETVRAARVPGGAMAVVEKGDVVYEGSFGVRSLKSMQPVTPDTVFPLASVSKTFAGILAADLIIAGDLDPQQPVTKSSPSFRLSVPGRADAITLEHALSHASGVVPNAYDNLVEAGQSLDVILPKFRKVKPVCRPGACYGYQNVIFSLIEPAIKDAVGVEYKDLISTKYFQPLGMGTASIGYDGFIHSAEKAYPHARPRRSQHFQQVRHSGDYYAVKPAAGVNASLRDMTMWLQAQMGAAPSVLSETTIALATKPRTKTTRETRRRFWRGHVSRAHYGLGWRIYEFEGETLIFHAGGIHGYRTAIAYAPGRGVGAVMLTNGESNATSRAMADFWAGIMTTPQTPTLSAQSALSR